MESLDAVWADILPTQGGTGYTRAGRADLRTARPALRAARRPALSARSTAQATKSVYVDSSFFDVLVRDYGSSGGPLAQEYVIAHEFGHHISDELGVLQRAQQDPEGAASGSVRAELQADCYAGVWAQPRREHSSTPTPAPRSCGHSRSQDIDDALSAAASVGDDRIQQSAGGRADPESFTHGTSAQRQRWFGTGYDSGDLRSCDTFAARDLG